jgi:hypothetical protein
MSPSGDSIVAWQGGGWARYVGEWATAVVGADIVLPRVALGDESALSVVNSDAGSSYQLLPNGSAEWLPAQPLSEVGRVDEIDALAAGFIAVGTSDGQLQASQLSNQGAQWSPFVPLADVVQVSQLRVTTRDAAAAVAWVDVQPGPETEAGEPSLVIRPGAKVLVGDAWSEPLALPEGAELPWVSLAPGGRALAIWTRLDAVSVSSYVADAGWSEPEQLAESSQLLPTGAVDGAGNLLALWPLSQRIAVQRKPAGGDWQALVSLESQVTVLLWSHVDEQGRVNLVWQNGVGTWWTRFE